MQQFSGSSASTVAQAFVSLVSNPRHRPTLFHESMAALDKVQAADPSEDLSFNIYFDYKSVW